MPVSGERPTDHPPHGDGNLYYRESLTIWGPRCSAQVRTLGEICLHHYVDAPRCHVEDEGQTFILSTLDSVLLRDLLNAATDRGFLPPTVSPSPNPEPDPPSSQRRPNWAALLHAITGVPRKDNIE